MTKKKETAVEKVKHLAGAALTAALRKIANAGETGTFTKPEVYEPLVEKGFVEINPAFQSTEGMPTRATAEGIASLQPKDAPEANLDTQAPVLHRVIPESEVSPLIAPGGYVLESNIPPPVAKSRGRSVTKEYPFEQMEIGNSFFVPATEAKPNPAKSLSSAISNAQKKFAVECPTGEMIVKDGTAKPKMINTRKFTVRPVEENGVVVGARVWRTA